MLGPDDVVYGNTFWGQFGGLRRGYRLFIDSARYPRRRVDQENAAHVQQPPGSPRVLLRAGLAADRAEWQTLRRQGLLDTQTNKPGGLVYELSPPSTPGGEWACTILHRWHNEQVPSLGSIAMDPDGRTLYGGTYVRNYASEGTIYRTSW
jgi:hypothetical protein